MAPPPDQRKSEQMGLGHDKVLGYNKQAGNDKRLVERHDEIKSPYATSTMPPRPDQRTCDPMKLVHNQQLEHDEQVGRDKKVGPDNQVGHGKQLGHDREPSHDKKPGHDKNTGHNKQPGQHSPSGNDKNSKKYVFDLQECINSLKAKVEDLEKYAAEVKKERMFYRNLRRGKFEDEDEDEERKDDGRA